MTSNGMRRGRGGRSTPILLGVLVIAVIALVVSRLVGGGAPPPWTGEEVYALDPARHRIVHEPAARIEILMLGGEEVFLDPGAAAEGWWWVRFFDVSAGDRGGDAPDTARRVRGPELEGMTIEALLASQGDRYRFGWIERYDPAVLAKVNAPRDPPLPPGQSADLLENGRQYRTLDDPDWKPLTPGVRKQLRAGAAEACGGADQVAELAPPPD